MDSDWRTKLNHIVYTLESTAFELQQDLKDAPDNWIFLVDFKKQGLSLFSSSPFMFFLSFPSFSSCPSTLACLSLSLFLLFSLPFL